MKAMNYIKNKRLTLCGISFLVVFAVVFICYKLFGYAPFGNRSLATEDGYYQFLDFFCWLKDFFAGKHSLTYNFGNGIGMPNLGFFMYYLSSPWNLLIVFFSKENLHTFFDLLIALKLSTAGFTACLFLNERFQRKINPILTVTLAVSFALSQYSFSKACVIMWLDGLFMLPLIMLGVYKLVRTKKPFMLAITVFIAICCNWYIAAVDCMFSILWFFMEYMIFASEKNIVKEKFSFLKSLVRYGIAMLSGVMLSCFFFIPMFFQMTDATRGSLDTPAFTDSFQGNMFTVVQNYALGKSSSIGHLCMFCGALALMGAFGFFASTKISGWVKGAAGGFLFIAILGCYWQPVYFIFSCFQGATSYFYRFEYICPFLLIFMSGYFFIQEEEKAALKKMTILTFIYVFLLFATEYFSYYIDFQSMHRTAFIQGLVLLLYAFSKIFANKKNTAGVMVILISVVIVFELGYNAKLLMEQYSGNTDVAWYKTYVSEQGELIKEIKTADTEKYRMTQTSGKGMNINSIANLDESLSADYWAIESYISMPTETQMDFLHHCGYALYNKVVLEKAMSILPVDSLLNVKYVLSQYEYDPLEVRSDITVRNGKATYENPYAMPFAFLMAGAGDFKPGYAGNTYTYQNELFRYISGIDADLYIPAEYKVLEGEETRLYTFDIPTGNYALYGVIPWYDDEPAWDYPGNSVMDLNGRIELEYPRYISTTNFYVPGANGGTKSYIKITSDDLESLREPQFYLLDLDLLQQIADNANEKSAQNIEIRDGYMKCSVTANEGERLFTSVPYTRGWSVKVNGRAVNPELIDGCLMAVPLSAGENTIVMSYHTPFAVPGIIVSILGLGILAVWFYFLNIRKKEV